MPRDPEFLDGVAHLERRVEMLRRMTDDDRIPHAIIEHQLRMCLRTTLNLWDHTMSLEEHLAVDAVLAEVERDLDPDNDPEDSETLAYLAELLREQEEDGR